MLQQYLWKDADTQLVEGYTNALWLYTDPATAMQHVLHCMYIELMVSEPHLQWTSGILSSCSCALMALLAVHQRLPSHQLLFHLLLCTCSFKRV